MRIYKAFPWIIIGILVMTTLIVSNNLSASSEYKQKAIASNLEHPWGMDWLPDGTILITERAGRLRILQGEQLSPEAVPGVPDVFAAGQGGLLDISVHPRFAENNYIYFTYSQGNNSANQTQVARGVFDGEAVRDLQVIFTVSQAKSGTQHFGSRIIWLPDETMLIAIGDGGNPPLQLEGDLIRQQAQNLRSHLGKVIRIHDDGSIPDDNPFVGNPEVDQAIWSYGHRNIQGLAFDPILQQVWATEHGARGGDELNLLDSGNNYGWPKVSHSREYSTGEPVAERQSLPGMVDPLLVWTPAIAPSGLTVYRGDSSSEWYGNLLAGGLVSQDVRRIVVDSSGKVLSETKIPINQRVRDVRTGPDGFVYILTDADNGQLIRLELSS